MFKHIELKGFPVEFVTWQKSNRNLVHILDIYQAIQPEVLLILKTLNFPRLVQKDLQIRVSVLNSRTVQMTNMVPEVS